MTKAATEKGRTIIFENAHIHKRCTFEITGPNASRTVIECRAPLTVALARELGIERMVFQRHTTKNNAPKTRGQEGSQKQIHSVNPMLVKSEVGLELGRSKVTITPKGLEQHKLDKVPCDAAVNFVVKKTDRGAAISFRLISTMPPHAFLDYLVAVGEAPGRIELLDDQEKQGELPGAVKDGEQPPGTVTIEVPGEEPLTMTDEELKAAGATFAQADEELERARKIRDEAAADGNPFDGDEGPTAA